MKDFGIFDQVLGVSPEVEKEQRMEELRHMAEYRAERSAKFAEWVKPENIAVRKAKHEEEALKALEQGLKMAALAKEQMAMAKDEKVMRTLPLITLREVIKPTSQPSLWRRIIAWFESW